MISPRLILIVALRAAGVTATAETLVAHYELNDDALDDSGNAYHGTIAGATATTALDGGAALFFDGDDAVAFHSALTADLLGSSARTVCLWARVDAFDGGTLFSYGSIVTNQRFAFYAGVAPEVFYLDRFDFTYEVALAGSDVGWHHYCNAYDGANWRLYYDGTLAAEWGVILATGAANALTIGVRNGADGYLSGAVDELYVYSSALSESEIQTLYVGDTLIAHYSFDDGTAAEDSDSSLDGTINGATATTGLFGSCLLYTSPSPRD